MTKTFRDLPEWQAAQRAYIAEGCEDMDPDKVCSQRVRAAYEMFRQTRFRRSKRVAAGVMVLAALLDLAGHHARGLSPLGVAAVVAFLAVRWLWKRWRHPFTVCWWCGGSGRNTGSTKRRYGRCWWCKGKPERLRPGARMVRRKYRKDDD